MTTTVLTPDAMTVSTGTVGVNGGTNPAVIKDANDSTYVSLSGNPGSTARWSLSTFTIGTGRLKYWTVRMRGYSSGPGYYMVTKTMLPASGTVWTEPAMLVAGGTNAAATEHVTAPFVPPSLVQAEIDGLEVELGFSTPGINDVLYVQELSVSVTWAVAPTANITYPTGTPALGTSSPTVTWTHTVGADGGPQVFAEIKAFTAAQYGAGGFSPDTSTAAYSTIVSGEINSKTIGPLANNTTFRVYVRTAQYINGGNHWSPWDFEGFSTAYTPSTVQTVTPVADNTNGLTTVTVARNTGTAAWASVEVERTSDGGVTWLPVRGATNVKTTNRFVTTWSANSVVVKDDEAPNGVSVTYRSRATTASGVVGDWVSSSATQWSMAGVVWLKDPLDPVLNVIIDVPEMPEPTHQITQGVHTVIGARFPVVVSDTRRAGIGTFVALTRTNAESQSFDAAARSPVKLLQFPASHLWGSRYIVLADVQELHLSLSTDLGYRKWQVAFIEVARPADETVY